jgi:hypothetical protein
MQRLFTVELNDTMIIHDWSQWPRGIRPFKDWDRGFESHSKNGCLRLFPCLCCPVLVAALQRADPPFKESYQLSITAFYKLVGREEFSKCDIF